MIALWNRLIRMPENRVAKKIFNWDVSIKGAWASTVEDILIRAGLLDSFQNCSVVNISMVKEILNSIFQNKWSQDILYKPKLRTFVMLKNQYACEKYVCAPLSKRQRSLCAQLRSGILPLHLETGRYRGIVEEERVCIYCDIHDIENEFHFMFYCPLYHELRQKLFNRCKNLDLIWLSDADRLCWIFEHKIFALAEYLEKAWDKRSKITYI